MAIEKMEFVSLTAARDCLDTVLEKCCESGCFQLESAVSSNTGGGERALQLLNDKNPYDVPLKNLASIATELDIKLEETEYSVCKLESGADFTDFCDSLEGSLAEASKQKQAALQIISQRKNAMIQIKHLNGLNEQFDRIFSCKHVHVRVGKLPLESRAKLDYYDQNFFFVPFEQDRNYCWGMYFCPKDDKELVDDLFTSLFFETVRIPDFVRGNTAEAFKLWKTRSPRRKRSPRPPTGS